MSYRIAAFGSVALPDAMLEDDLSTSTVAGGLVDTVGGAFDAYGAGQRLPRQQEIRLSGLYVGDLRFLVDHNGNQLMSAAGNTLIASTGEYWLRAQVDALRGMVGRRDQLWRRRSDDGALQWRRARLLGVGQTGDVETAAAIVAKIDARFEAAAAAWRGAAAVVDPATLTAGTARTVTVTAAGNAPVEDAVITFTATGTVTALRVRVLALGIDWTWTGSLTAGQTLVVDCGALTVRKQGADAYGGFALNAAHTAGGWLPLAVGDNALLLLASGGGGSVAISHYDQWL